LDELPEGNVEVTEAQGGFGGYGGYGASRFDAMTSFGSNYSTPGWQRAQAKKGGGFSDDGTPYDAAADDDDAGLSSLSPRGRVRSGEARSGEGTRPFGSGTGTRHLPLTIEGELVAKSTGTISAFTLGDRVFHQKFGNGNVTAIDGNKLTIQFDRAGEKRVVDSFVERA
jgi:DNA helicase-2/ATP-dependent DNA helicase PcrA